MAMLLALVQLFSKAGGCVGSSWIFLTSPLWLQDAAAAPGALVASRAERMERKALYQLHMYSISEKGNLSGCLCHGAEPCPIAREAGNTYILCV